MHNRILSIGTILILLFLISCNTQRKFGKVHGLVGSAEKLDKNKSAWKPVTQNSTIASGDSIRTGGKSYLEISFGKENLVTLGESTKVCISDTLNKKRSHDFTIFNTGGEVLSDVPSIGTGNSYEVRTPNSIATVKGTHFVVFFAPVPFVTNVNVFNGAVNVWNPFLPPALILPPIIVLPGFFTTIGMHHAPMMPIKMNYGHLKKYERLLGPRQFMFYHKKFGYAPMIGGPDKHFFKNMEKADKKAFGGKGESHFGSFGGFHEAKGSDHGGKSKGGNGDHGGGKGKKGK